MKRLKKFYYKLFPRYEILEQMCVEYEVGDGMIRASRNESEENKWVLHTELEDNNHSIGWVWLCRRKRITE